MPECAEFSASESVDIFFPEKNWILGLEGLRTAISMGSWTVRPHCRDACMLKECSEASVGLYLNLP